MQALSRLGVSKADISTGLRALAAEAEAEASLSAADSVSEDDSVGEYFTVCLCLQSIDLSVALRIPLWNALLTSQLKCNCR